MKKILITLTAFFATFGCYLNAQDTPPAEGAAEESSAVAAAAETLRKALEAAPTLQDAENAITAAFEAGLTRDRVKAIALLAASINPLVADVAILQTLPPAPLGGSQPVPEDKRAGNNEVDNTLGGSTVTGGDGHIPVGEGEESNTGSTYN